MGAAIQLPVYRASGTLVIRSIASLVKGPLKLNFVRGGVTDWQASGSNNNTNDFATTSDADLYDHI